MSSIFSETQDTIVENRWESTMVDQIENSTLEELLDKILNFSNENERNKMSLWNDERGRDMNQFTYRQKDSDERPDDLEFEEPTVQDVVEEQTFEPDTSREIQTQNLKLKVLEHLKEITSVNIECHQAPVPVRDLIEGLTSKYSSSFYVVNLGTVIDKFLLWKQFLPRVEPFYAVKSNPDKLICNTLHLLSAGFDCASKAEIEQVLEMGCCPENIIFANPCKPVEFILYAKENGVEMMTFDNFAELDKIHKHFPKAKLVLRILPDDSHSLMPFGSKFGASFKDSIKLIERCKELDMNLIGVSFHVGSGCYSSVAWVEALKLARSVFDEAEKRGFEMTLLDIGGGWPGVETGELKVSAIGTDISPVIDALFPPEVRVISEPGRFFCAESVTLATVVVSKRERIVSSAGGTDEGDEEPEHQLYISDGIYGSFNCVIFDHYKPEPKLLSEDYYEREIQKSTLFGPTCDSMDVIVKGYPLPETNVGEWLYFEHMGAYTRAAGSTFNGMPLPSVEYVMIATPYVFNESFK